MAYNDFSITDNLKSSAEKSMDAQQMRNFVALELSRRQAFSKKGIPLTFDASEDFYYVASDGKINGPLSVEKLSQLVSQGAVSVDTLIWKSGMTDWQEAGSLPEVTLRLSVTPPPLP